MSIPGHSVGRGRAALAVAVAVVLLVAACSPLEIAQPLPSPTRGAGSQPVPDAGTPPPPLLDPSPTIPTPAAAIAGLLRIVRSPSLSFHLDGHAHFEIGSLVIDYIVSANVVGDDRSIQSTESFNNGTRGQALEYRFVGGVLYKLSAKTGQWTADGSRAGAFFGRTFFELQPTLVLGDLGPTDYAAHPAYDLRVLSGIDLYPPQFQDGTIGTPHDPQERLELIVSPDGVPLGAHETRSLAGTIDGSPGTATGDFEMAFTQFGSAKAPVAPDLPNGVATPTAQPAATPIPATWTTPAAGARGFTVSFPGTPTERSRVVQSIRANANLTVESRLLTYPSGLAFAEQDALYPSRYIATESTAVRLDQARDDGAAEVGGQLVGSLATTVAGQPAIAYDVDQSGEVDRAVVFLLGDRLVEMAVIGTPDEVGSAVADQFLDSVQLVP